RDAIDDLDAVPVKLVGDDVQLMFDDQVLSRHQVPQGQALFERARNAAEGAELKSVQVKYCILQGFARERAGVDARPAEDRFFFDDSHALSKLGRLDRRLLPCGSAADDEQIKLTHVQVGGRMDENEDRPL